eukprot:6181132-Pleurochrysis_carterae.AAC.2
MLRPLLLRFADSSERIREAAATLFDAWQKRVDVGVLGGALPFLVPVLVERLGTEAQTEPAEEIRAILVSMTASVLTRCRQLLRPYLAEVGAICLGCCRDRHPEVLKGACALMRVLGEAVLQPLVKREGGKAVQPFSAKLIEALLPHLTHRHAAVRVQARPAKAKARANPAFKSAPRSCRSQRAAPRFEKPGRVVTCLRVRESTSAAICNTRSTHTHAHSPKYTSTCAYYKTCTHTRMRTHMMTSTKRTTYPPTRPPT